jgi:hypothetical protein
MNWRVHSFDDHMRVADVAADCRACALSSLQEQFVKLVMILICPTKLVAGWPSGWQLAAAHTRMLATSDQSHTH